MLLPKRDTEHHTYADYLTWSDDQRYELIDGIAYVREPTPTWGHQKVVGELFYQVRRALEGTSHEACIAPFDVRLPKSSQEDDQIDTVVQPDVFIVCDLEKIDARGVCGAPDWIAEVLSPGTARHDQKVKVPVYERAGVREVWLIDPLDCTLTLYRLDAGRYGRPTVLALEGQTPLSAVPGVTIDWEQVLAAIG